MSFFPLLTSVVWHLTIFLSPITDFQLCYTNYVRHRCKILANKSSFQCARQRDCSFSTEKPHQQMFCFRMDMQHVIRKCEGYWITLEHHMCYAALSRRVRKQKQKCWMWCILLHIVVLFRKTNELHNIRAGEDRFSIDRQTKNQVDLSLFRSF